MRKQVGLTEERMNHKGFRRTEEAILKVFFNGKCCSFCVQEIARKIGVARSTIYSHHRALREILPDYEKYIFKKYKKMLRKTLKDKNVSLKRLYLKMLLFMIQEKKVFEMLIKNERRILVDNMIIAMEEEVIKHARLPKNSKKVFGVYVSEVAGLMEKWGRRGFPDDEIGGLLSEIMYLTDTARIRLAPLLDK